MHARCSSYLPPRIRLEGDCLTAQVAAGPARSAPPGGLRVTNFLQVNVLGFDGVEPVSETRQAALVDAVLNLEELRDSSWRTRCGHLSGTDGLVPRTRAFPTRLRCVRPI